MTDEETENPPVHANVVAAPSASNEGSVKFVGPTIPLGEAEALVGTAGPPPPWDDGDGR